MDKLVLDPSPTSPQIVLSAHEGMLRIAGRSIMDDPDAFYAPVIGWLLSYAMAPSPHTQIILHLEYYNSATAAVLVRIIRLCEGLPHASILWHYDADDEDMRDTGHEFATLANIPVRVEATEI